MEVRDMDIGDWDIIKVQQSFSEEEMHDIIKAADDDYQRPLEWKDKELEDDPKTWDECFERACWAAWYKKQGM